ncbi:MAG: phage integrase SAM-like domain-containing protein, partial [Bacteroidota bacterium]
MKKNFLPYIPARLRKGENKWMIVYYQTPPNEQKRKCFRPTFDLNRIKNLRERERIGKRYVRKINHVLELGYPFCVDIEGNRIKENIDTPKENLELKDNLRLNQLEEKLDLLISLFTKEQLNQSNRHKKVKQLEKKNIVECIEKARAIKMQSRYRTTRRSYNSHANLFIQYLKNNNLEKTAIADFSKAMAIDYMDWWAIQGISNNTWNNKLSHIRAIFTELVQRQHLPKNPFFGIKEKDKSRVSKDCLNDEEMKILAPALKKHNIW